MSKKNKILLIIICAVIVFCAIFASLYVTFVVVPNQEKKKQQALFQQYYNNKLSNFEQENKNIQQADIVFIGDSLTDGYNLNTFYPEFNTVNRGIAGDITFTLENRLKVSLYDINPKVIVMLIGGNNLNTMFNNYENIVSDIKQKLPNTELILLSLTAMGKQFKPKNAIAALNNAKIEIVAQQYHCIYIDIFTSLYNINTNEIYSHFTTDGAHLTEAGYATITSKIKPILQNLIN